MSSHKNKQHLQTIKDAVEKSEQLDASQKSQSVQKIEEWIVEDKAFGTLKNELLEISEFFETLFAELGLK